jgi:hypothetical protein
VALDPRRRFILPFLLSYSSGIGSAQGQDRRPVIQMADPEVPFEDERRAPPREVEETAEPRESHPHPVRTLALRYAHVDKVSFNNVEVVEALAFSAGELFGKFDDYLGVDLGWDYEPHARLGLVFASVYKAWAITYYSHEFGHARDGIGCTPSLSLDWDDWGPGVPAARDEPCPVDDRIRIRIGGLNQQQWNAQSLYRRTSSTGTVTYDQGISYIMNQMADVAYMMISLGYGGDVDSYRAEAARQGLRITAGTWITAAVVSAALSLRTWESLYTALQYPFEGRRSREVAHASLGGIRVYPPDFSVYAHQGGIYVQAEMLVSEPLGSGSRLLLEGGGTVQGDRKGHGGFLAKDVPILRAGRTVTSVNLDFRVSQHKTDRTLQVPAGAPDELPFWIRTGGPKRGLGVEAGPSIIVGSWRLELGYRYLRGDILYNDIAGFPEGHGGFVEMDKTY